MNYSWLKVLILAQLLFLLSCSSARKLKELEQTQDYSFISIPQTAEMPQEISIRQEERDTLVVKDPDGNDVLIMKAVRDENGEMVANDIIDAALVTAKFKNVAERNGKVDLVFLVSVPSVMQDEKWQLRLKPSMYIQGETVSLDSIIISGKDYKEAQLRGYEQYEKFLNSIIKDSLLFIHRKDLEIFLKRNIPELYSLKTDTSYVSDDLFCSMYGVNQSEAVEHYTNMMRIKSNRRKISRKDKMFQKYVKMPYLTQGLRLDTVMRNDAGDFVYEYVQTITSRPALKKVEIDISGSIFEYDKLKYDIPQSDKLTFYISSLSSLVEDGERYITEIVGRELTDNTVCWIDFEQGSSELKRELSNNSIEIARIERIFADLKAKNELVMDSIRVTASCSPEGSYQWNESLSYRRSESISEFFSEMTGDSIKYVINSVPENWDMLVSLVDNDDSLSIEDKNSFSYWVAETDPDTRESGLSRQKYYPYLRYILYPKLRTVRFDFYLHRKGFVQDTVMTTVLDTTYMRGLEALKEGDYKTAVSILRPYRDVNAAIACCAMNYDATSMDILRDLPQTDKVEYLRALVFSRIGDDQQAVQHFLNSCRINQAYIHRGNLDPEISALIRKYDLNLYDY